MITMRINLATIELSMLMTFLEWLKECPLKKYELTLEIAKVVNDAEES